MSARISVAVVGAGRFGRKYVEKYAVHDIAQLSAIVDPSPEAELFARRRGVRWFSSVRELPPGLIAAATVAVPDKEHFRISSALLHAGIDVLVEKPIALRLSDADALIETADRLNRILQVGHIEHFNPAVRAMKPGPGPMNIVAVRRGPGRHSQVTTDVVMDLMIHDIGLTLKWIGAKPGIVLASSEHGQHSAVDRARAVLSFPDGSSALLIAKRDDAACRRLRVTQGNRRFHIDCLAKKLDGPDGAVSVSEEDALEAQIGAFLTAVRDRTEPAVSGALARSALEIALSVHERIVENRAHSAA